jgi:hypothetical protein
VTAWLLAPAGLSLVVLGAHFLRAGHVVLVVLALVMLGQLFVRRPWAGRAVQVALVLGALEWVRTTLVLTGERASMGRPFGRMAVILGAVAALCALSAWLLRAERARRWFGMVAAAGRPA